MNKLPDLVLPKKLKLQLPVFATRRIPCGVFTPLVSAETYIADRERCGTAEGTLKPQKPARKGVTVLLPETKKTACA